MRSRAVEVKIAVAFAAVVAGFVGAVAHVPLALVPSTRRAERIQQGYAEAVRGVSELRACRREMRDAALTAQCDEALASVVEVHAAEARSEAEQIHAALRRLSTFYVVLAASAGFGAIALLVKCLALFRRYTRSADDRLAELDAFAAQVAHDLRGPLQTIQFTVQMIAKETENVAVKRLASSATASVQRLVTMIRDLLQFARSGARISEDAATNVASVVSQTCEEMLPRAERAQVKVMTRSDPSAQARVAPVALKTIVANLLENALKYSNLGHPNVVDVSATSSGDHVRLVVKDSGTGIPREILPHVFEPFVRGSTCREGYGLGLATVKRLVDVHGGTIAVESEEGRGTTFVIHLPAARAPTMPEAGRGRVEPERYAEFASFSAAVDHLQERPARFARPGVAPAAAPAGSPAPAVQETKVP